MVTFRIIFSIWWLNKMRGGKKVLIIGLVILLSLSSISFISTASGEYIYVDDDNTEGPWDGSWQYPYQYIQDGIDASNDSDTVRVSSGFYYESIVIANKSISLLGSYKYSTIIDGNNSDRTLLIMGGNPTISGFTIRNGYRGVFLLNTQNTTIRSCIIKDNNATGIYFVQSDNNNIIGNSISGNGAGITMGQYFSNNNNIYHNNFSNNIQNAYDGISSNNWDNGYPSGGNKWSDYNGSDENCDGIGDTPYNITDYGDDQDRYPLMNNWTIELKANCGDVDGSCNIDIDDIVVLIAYVLNNGTAPWPEICVGDVDGSGNVDIDDIVYLIAYIFNGGPAPVTDCC